MTDLKKIGVVTRPLFSKADKWRIVIEAASLILIGAIIIAIFTLWSWSSNTPEPVAEKKTGEVSAAWKH